MSKNSVFALLAVAGLSTAIVGCGDPHRPDFSKVRPGGTASSSSASAAQVPQTISDLGFFYKNLSANDPARYTNEVASNAGCDLARDFRQAFTPLGTGISFEKVTGDFCAAQSRATTNVSTSTINCSLAQIEANTIISILTELEDLCSSRQSGDQALTTQLIDTSISYRTHLGIVTTGQTQ